MSENRNHSNRENERQQGGERSRHERGLGNERARNRENEGTDSSERVTNRESGGDRGVGRGNSEDLEDME